MKQRRPLASHFDVIVLGAGPSGSAAAAESARHGLRTAHVGRDAGAGPNIGECLGPGIRPQLEKAGVWNEFLRAGHTRSTGIRSFWGSPEAADRDFLLSPYGAGWHVDRARFDAMMRSSAMRCGAEPLECASLRGVARTAAGWRLELATEAGERLLEGSIVIDATGRPSVFARRAGAKRRLLDSLTGVAGYFSLGDSASSESVLLVEAVENGWWYTAPLPGGRLVAVFLTDADYIQRAMLTQAGKWLGLLQSTMQQHRRVGSHGGVLQGGIRILPAESSFLEQVAGDAWIAAGDSAAAFDPLSSQGILSAISSGVAAAQTAAAWLAGDRKAPAAYADSTRARYAEYLAHRDIYYRIEQRWPASGFWKTRHEPPPALSYRKGATV